jgi:hypothetical protein
MAAVRRIDVEQHVELADILRLRVAVAVAPDGGGWTVLDDDLFPRLTRLDLTVSVGPVLSEKLVEAYVVESRVGFGARPGQSFLDVVALDPSVLMNLDEKVRPWPDMSDADIARAVFGEHGFTEDVEDTGRTPDAADVVTMQRGTDLQLLRSLAARNGYEIGVEADPAGGPSVGRFGPPRTDDPEQGVLNVAFGGTTNVDEFAARFDMLRPTEAVARGIETSGGTDDPMQAAGAERKEIGGASLLPADRPRKVLLTGAGLSNTGDLQALAQATVDQSTWALIAEGRLSAAAYGGVLRARRPVSVRGAGRTFSGTWYVERVLHSLEGDRYVQQFTLRRNAMGLSGAEDFVDDGALAPA